MNLKILNGVVSAYCLEYSCRPNLLFSHSSIRVASLELLKLHVLFGFRNTPSVAKNTRNGVLFEGPTYMCQMLSFILTLQLLFVCFYIPK